MATQPSRTSTKAARLLSINEIISCRRITNRPIATPKIRQARLNKPSWNVWGVTKSRLELNVQ